MLELLSELFRMEKARDLLEKINLADECNYIEAKKASDIGRSVLETICALSNEPDLGGGYILLGVAKEESSLFPSYVVYGVENTDKLQLDLSTQCATVFNQPIRPEITVESIGGKSVVNVFVPELPQSQKPVYFRTEGLPRGAYRRIGSSDQRCTDDDLFIFYSKEDTLDSSIIKDTSVADISEEAVQLYRTLRSKVNPFAEELQYSDIELLQSLGCLKQENGKIFLTYAGLLVFGKRQSHRRLLPMVRVDYIRVPGNEWVENPDSRFTTVDMRGPLIELVQRTFSVISDDLPKGFLLPEGEIQADTIGLPSKVLREAIVNAFIHRTYRESQPIQIIRYGNRLEIRNPGFSLKPEDQLGEPGSKNRNPFIAAIFHETNLAETKGSGIRTMRTLMERAALMPPTFESDHGNNVFSVRLLLHHFLNEEDLRWLMRFKRFDLSDSQKRALIFMREVGAIDNATYRQLNGSEILKASGDLRNLRDKDLTLQKGKGRKTYYIPNPSIAEWGLKDASAPLRQSVGEMERAENQLITAVEPFDDASAPVDSGLLHQLPPNIQEMVMGIPVRANDQSKLEHAILELCAHKAWKSQELSSILGRTEKYLLRNFISPLRDAGKLEYTQPEMPNHPQQAYRTVTSGD